MDTEQILMQKPLPDPPAPLRAAMLARARRERRWRATVRVWGWALATAAALLLVLNLHFGRVHESSMAALIGPQPIERVIDPVVFVRQFEQRQRMLSLWLGQEAWGDVREERL